MIEAAERAGFKPGGTIIEPTSGNTGHGLAIAAAPQGLPLHLRDGRQAVDREAGAAPGVRGGGRALPHERRARVARELLLRGGQAGPRHPGRLQARPVLEPENPTAHEQTTGPSWDQTEGRITHLVASVGTGGTVTGTGRFLKSKKPDLVIIGADPEGSVLSGDTARPYLTEGVGEDFFPGTYDAAVVDRWVRLGPGRVRDGPPITREEGILAGSPAAPRWSRASTRPVGSCARGDAARDRIMVVIFPDGGRNYLSKLYNDEWMRANGLLTTTGAVVRVDEVLRARHHGAEMPDVVLARTTDRVGAAIDLLQLYGISSTAGVGAGPRTTRSTASSARSAKGLWSGPTETRASWSGPSAR